MANIYESWELWLKHFDMGGKSGAGRWHEARVGDPWLNANALFADGHVLSKNNTDDRFTVDIGYMPHDSLDKILEVFEVADELR